MVRPTTERIGDVEVMVTSLRRHVRADVLRGGALVEGNDWIGDHD
jgi:hypothetical protein